jgi:hypothetical protein
MKFENSRHFFVDSSRVRKIFRRFSNLFFSNDLTTFIRKLIFFDVNMFNEAFFVSKNSFDKFDEFEQRKLFFRKKMLFFLFNDWFFRKRLIISLFKVFFWEKNFDISTATKMLIDVDLNDNVSSKINNWNSIDDEIFFSSSISKQYSFQNYLIRVFVLIFCRIVFHRCSQIFATRSHDTLHKIFFLLFWKNRLLCTCRKISSHWI